MKIINPLFNEFDPVTLAEWETQLLKDLKGKPLSILNFNPEIDLSAKSYYHPEEFNNQLYSKSDVLKQDNNDWYITEEFVDIDSKQTNHYILKALNEGANGLSIQLSKNSNFKMLLAEVLMAHIYLHLTFENIQQVHDFNEFIKNNKVGKLSIELPFLTKGLTEGKFIHHIKDLSLIHQSFPQVNIHSIYINGSDFANFGATSVQELAIIIAGLNEYFQTLTNEGISLKGIENKIAISVGTSLNYVVGIAKMRALKELFAQLLAQWELNTKVSPWIHAKTTFRNLAMNDRHNNLLRQTTAAMSAVFGGVNSLTVMPYSNWTNNDDTLSVRMARNLQLILKEESYTNQVVDPAAGAYAVESMTDQLIDNAWGLFMKIEEKGGLKAAINSNFIQELLVDSKAKQIKRINDKSQTLLGVNKYPNSQEDWVEIVKDSPIQSGDFNAFSLFNLEKEFEK